MRIALIISITISLISLSLFARIFFRRFKLGFYYIDKYEEAVQDILKIAQENDPQYVPPIDYDKAIDLRGTPTHVCPCGSGVWLVKVAFEDYEIATYYLDMECLACGSLATAPTLLDRNIIE
jgi:hypothetical protein